MILQLNRGVRNIRKQEAQTLMFYITFGDFLEKCKRWFEDQKKQQLIEGTWAKWLEQQTGYSDIHARKLRQISALQSMGEDIMDFLRKFSIDFDAVADFLIIKLTAKKKELKREPRMFGLTTYENRSRLLLTSMNMFSFLDRYAPNVCFSLSKEALIKKLLAMKELASFGPQTNPSRFLLRDTWCSCFLGKRYKGHIPFGKLPRQVVQHL
ncbi:hypothetical protein RRG08_042209 [Elysia crispata]|uniref:Uncharacterized protein n=1 Tax=Elysia crispata TaxID=231223 RepID=A0AAE1EF82_9GAST|nr:hypothetical protein RRG08_042209 [Elysia crispata]